MKFVCADRKTGNNIFSFCDTQDQNECPSCKKWLLSKDANSGVCKKGHFCLIRDIPETDRIFRFCLAEAKNRKQAKYYANIAVAAYSSVGEIFQSKNSVYENATELAVHNTRNLNAEINSKLLSLVDEAELSEALDKIQYIEGRVKGNSRGVAREILSVLKSTGQIMSEYDVIDLMDPRISFQGADFNRHKIHTLCVMSYYLYEQELKNRGIFVRLGRSEEYCFANFPSARTAISQLFDNCLKYCKENTEIELEFHSVSDCLIELSMEMTSLFFENSEKESLTLPGFRGRHSQEQKIQGKGAGLGIVVRMMELNGGTFDFESFEGSLFYSGGVPYSTNRFVLGFKRGQRIA